MISFEKPDEHHLYLFLCHLIYVMACFSKFPKSVSTSHELIEIFQLHFFFISVDFLKDFHKFTFLKFMLFRIKNFFYVFVLFQQILIAVLTTVYLVIYRFFQHCETFLQDFSKAKIFVKSFFTLDQIDDGQNHFTLLSSQSPNTKGFLHFSLQIF